MKTSFFLKLVSDSPDLSSAQRQLSIVHSEPPLPLNAGLSVDSLVVVVLGEGGGSAVCH